MWRFLRRCAGVWLGVLALLLWPGVLAAQGNWRIGQAQELLQAAGFDPGAIDGILGPRTREALRRYQAHHGLPTTGVLDEATRQHLVGPARPHPAVTMQPEAWGQEPPGGAFTKLSALAQLPDFLPGLGTLYVDPRRLPVGPFLAYDRQGQLVSVVYMLPLRELRAGQAFPQLAAAQAPVQHVDIYYNNGHPGVPEPHYHIVLWYIPPEQVQALD